MSARPIGTILETSVRSLAAPLAAFAIVAGLGLGGEAHAYAEYGYYAGAYASLPGGICDAQGINPYGGCTPGTYPLWRAVGDTQPLGYPDWSRAVADLPTASLTAKVSANYDMGNQVQGTANFMDTFTIAGALPQPIQIVVMLSIESTSNNSSLEALLIGAGGVAAAYDVQPDSCFWAIYGGAECDLGSGHFVHKISAVETVDDRNRSFQLGAALYARSMLGYASYGSIDSAATLQVNLPPGLRYTTASGVFPAPAVPEPPSWALILAGLAGLRWLSAAVTRRRPRAPAPAPCR